MFNIHEFHSYKELNTYFTKYSLLQYHKTNTSRGNLISGWVFLSKIVFGLQICIPNVSMLFHNRPVKAAMGSVIVNGGVQWSGGKSLVKTKLATLHFGGRMKMS